MFALAMVVAFVGGAVAWHFSYARVAVVLSKVTAERDALQAQAAKAEAVVTAVKAAVAPTPAKPAAQTAPAAVSPVAATMAAPTAKA